MTAASKEARVERVTAVVEAVLTEIAAEHDLPQKAVPAMAEFFMDLQQQIMRISHERLMAFLQQKHQPGD